MFSRLAEQYRSVVDDLVLSLEALARCLKALLALSRSADDLVLNIGRRGLDRTGAEPAEPSLLPAP